MACRDFEPRGEHVVGEDGDDRRDGADDLDAAPLLEQVVQRDLTTERLELGRVGQQPPGDEILALDHRVIVSRVGARQVNDRLACVDG